MLISNGVRAFSVFELDGCTYLIKEFNHKNNTAVCQPYFGELTRQDISNEKYDKNKQIEFDLKEIQNCEVLYKW